MEDTNSSSKVGVVADLRPAPGFTHDGHTVRAVIPVLVRDVMTSTPITVDPTATVRDIAHVLLQHDIRCVPVVDIGDTLIGVVSEADLVCREGYPTVRSHHLAAFLDETVAERRHHWTARAEGLTAGEIMTTGVITCGPTEPIAVAVRRMLQHAIRTLPVVHDGHLVGVLSRHDILPLFDRTDGQVRTSVTELLINPLLAPEGHAAQTEVRDGVVILTGSVRYPSDRAVLADLVRQLPGVLEVVDRLTVREREPKPAFPHDTDWR
jgi:CBS domain-containing protein